MIRTVTVYEDPITRQKPEGKAVIIRKMDRSRPARARGLKQTRVGEELAMNKAEIMKSWERHGLFCDTYSPGDGVTRYRFTLTPGQQYFSDSGIYTALSWKEANTFATGFILAK